MVPGKELRSPRLIWFFGPSAAGKGTLVRAVATDAAHPLRKHLALGERVEVCAASLDKEVARERVVGVIGLSRSTVRRHALPRPRLELGGQRSLTNLQNVHRAKTLR